MVSSGDQVFTLKSLRQGISEFRIRVRKELGENVSVVPPGHLVCLALTLLLLCLRLTLVKSLNTGGESSDGVRTDIVSLGNEITEK